MENLVIIPTYNEIENINTLTETVLSLNVPFHILYIDDNSPDGTAEEIKKLQEKHKGQIHLIQREKKLGLGTAYITGFKWALEREYIYIYEMDADFSHNPKDLEALHNACANEKADLAIGSRYLTGVNVVNWPMGRVLMSYCASSYVRFVLGVDIKDTTAGFKCYNRKVLEAIDIDRVRFKGYAFQIEMKFAASKLGFNIKEVPIIFTDRKQGSSKMSGGIFNEALWGVFTMKVYSIFKPHFYEKKHS